MVIDFSSSKVFWFRFENQNFYLFKYNASNFCIKLIEFVICILLFFNERNSVQCTQKIEVVNK